MLDLANQLKFDNFNNNYLFIGFSEVVAELKYGPELKEEILNF